MGPLNLSGFISLRALICSVKGKAHGVLVKLHISLSIRF